MDTQVDVRFTRIASHRIERGMGTLCSKARHHTQNRNAPLHGSASNLCSCPCSCSNRRTPREHNTEMQRSTSVTREPDRPRIHQPVHSILIAGSGASLSTDGLRPASWPSPLSLQDQDPSPRSSPKTKSIFINIERNAIPKGGGGPDYCILKKDHDMYTLLVDEDIVKDVYVNYERIRSYSL